MRTSRRLWLAGGLLVILAASLAQRVLPVWDSVYPGAGGVQLLGADPYYHLRHAAFATAHFPALQRWDLGTHYPHGTRAVAGLYDVLIAAVARAAHGRDAGIEQIAEIAAWSAPVLGLLGLAVLMALAARLTTGVLGLCAGVLVWLYPGSLLPRSYLGFADHHVLEVLCFLLSTLGLYRALEAARAGEPARKLWPWALPLAAFVFAWHGAPLHVAIQLLALCGVLLLSGWRREPMWPFARVMGVYFGAVLVLVSAVALLRPDWVIDPDLLRYTQLGLLAAVVAIPAAVALLERRRARGGDPRALLLAGAALVCAGAALAIASHAGLRGMLGFALARKTDAISEHAHTGLSALLDQHGALLVFAALGVPALLVSGARGALDAGCACVLAIALLVVALLLRTGDYHYLLAPSLALIAVLALHAVSARLKPRPRAGLAAAAVACAIVPVWPAALAATPLPSAAQVRALHFVHGGWTEALAWLARETPRPAIPTDARSDTPFVEGARPLERSYGVLAPWDDGHMVAALGRRTVVFSQSPNQALARFWMLEDEDAAHRVLHELGDVRYVVLDGRTPSERFLTTALQAGIDPGRYLTLSTIEHDEQRIPIRRFGRRHLATLAAQLYMTSGMHLGRFRLVYETAHETFVHYLSRPSGKDGSHAVEPRAFPIEPFDERAFFAAKVGRVEPAGDGYLFRGFIEPSVKVFEHVEGALVRGQAPPGMRIELELDLYAEPSGRVLRYLRGTVADANGRFALRVAYGSTGAPARGSAVRARSPYRAFYFDGGQRHPLAEFHIDHGKVAAGSELTLGRIDPLQLASAAAAQAAGHHTATSGDAR